VATVGLIPRLASDAAAELAREMVRWLVGHGHQALGGVGSSDCEERVIRVPSPGTQQIGACGMSPRA